MGINSRALVDALASHAAASGHFDRVAKHEPKNAPGMGLSASIWVQHIGPAVGSGLKSTSGLVVMNLRVMSDMVQEPQDDIDPLVMAAVDDLMAAYSANFTLDGLVRCVDLLGMSGTALRADAGYLQIGGTQGGMYRVMVITIPLIINDAWEQSA
ncbi:hypothetical protein RB614_37770 [Phytohabitans sp. ZYX-F-186]|uniref:Uncharacterized protein n=1 Tax=Phytohabitans maris TaxID=3071409 RepID=A0ABU0ZT92_9ACTN|nr:hypothetical protein [Phytohabitans sp. ZYX-F-186]MDQ7910258.1 hypothetical protein [Phytohabitans sp. ZYX-F-186]